MSAENVEIIRRGFEAFTDEGIEGLAPLIDPDMEATAPPELSTEPAVYRGMDGIRRWFAGFEGSMENVHFEADQFVDAGDKVIVAARLVARGAGSGLQVEQSMVQLWTMRDGKAIRLDNYADMKTARDAAGLAPDSAPAS